MKAIANFLYSIMIPVLLTTLVVVSLHAIYVWRS